MSKQVPLGRLIGVARRRLRQAVGRRVARYDLSSQQFWVLVHVHEVAETALCGISDVLRIDPPTASRIVGALTRRGLLRALADPADRRRARLKLTADGRALARELQPLATELRAAVERDLTRPESAELRRLLQKVITGLDRYDVEGESR